MSCNQAPFCLYTLRTISDRTEGTFERLRYLLGGDRLKQTLEGRTVLPVVILDSLGRTYTLDAAEIPGGRGDGFRAVLQLD